MRRAEKNPGWSGPGVLEEMQGWLRGKDSNLRPSGYEPDELPLLHSAPASIPADYLWAGGAGDGDGVVTRYVRSLGFA